MSEDPLWTIDDLAARYELEPQLRDVFVEGIFDQDVLCACFKTKPNFQRVCYPINSVSIPPDVLKKHKLTDGNKQRVIALALELDKGAEKIAYRCLIDSDLDHWIDPNIATISLVRTKYSSLDLYFFSEDFLKNLLVTVAKTKIVDWTNFFSSFVEVLKDLYAFRLADAHMDLHLSWTDWSKCLSRKGSTLVLDSGDYITRVLLTNAKGKLRPDFKTENDNWRNQLNTDPRLCIRGHDFVELMAWVITKFGGRREFSTPNAIEGLFVLAAKEASEVLELL